MDTKNYPLFKSWLSTQSFQEGGLHASQSSNPSDMELSFGQLESRGKEPRGTDRVSRGRSQTPDAKASTYEPDSA